MTRARQGSATRPRSEAGEAAALDRGATGAARLDRGATRAAWLDGESTHAVPLADEAPAAAPAERAHRRETGATAAALGPALPGDDAGGRGADALGSRLAPSVVDPQALELIASTGC